jgi:hypothetical protein
LHAIPACGKYLIANFNGICLDLAYFAAIESYVFIERLKHNTITELFEVKLA